MWSNLPDEAEDKLFPQTKSITIEGIHIPGSTPSTAANDETIDEDEKATRTLGKTERQKKSLIRMNELRLKVEGYQRMIEKTETRTAFGLSGSSDFEGSGKSTEEKVANLTKKLTEATRQLEEQRSSLFRSFIDRLYTATGREKQTKSTQEAAEESVLYGAFSTKEGGNHLSLYAPDVDEQDDGLGDFTDMTSRTSSASSHDFLRMPWLMVSSKKPKVKNGDFMKASPVEETVVITGLGKHTMARHFFSPCSENDLSVCAAVVDRNFALDYLRNAEKQAEEQARSANEIGFNLSSRSKADLGERIHELEAVVAILDVVIRERQKRDLLEQYRETHDQKLLIAAGKIDIVPVFQTQKVSRTEEPSQIIEPSLPLVSGGEAIVKDQKSAQKTIGATSLSGICSAKPLSRLEQMKERMRTQSIKDANLNAVKRQAMEAAEELRKKRKEMKHQQ